MPNGTYGGVRGKETKVGQKTFVSRPTRFAPEAALGLFSASVNAALSLFYAFVEISLHFYLHY